MRTLFQKAIAHIRPGKPVGGVRFARALGLACLAAVLLVRVWDPAPMQILRLKALDFYQLLKPRQVTTNAVTIVDVDEESLAEIGQWPWPRTVIADMIEKVTQAGAIVIGFDIVFAEADRMSPAEIARSVRGLDDRTSAALRRLPSNDKVLAAAIRKSRVVLAQAGFERRISSQGAPLKKTPVAEVGDDPRRYLVGLPGLVRNIMRLEKAAMGLGVMTMEPDPDGIVRRVPAVINVGGDLIPSLAVEILRVAAGQSALAIKTDRAGVHSIVVAGVRIPTDNRGRFWVHYAPHDPARFISAKDAIAGVVPPARFAKKIVLVGTSAAGLLDIKSTPLGVPMPGVEVQAQLLENILSKNYLIRPNNAIGAELVAGAGLGLLMIVLVPMLGAIRSLLLGAAMAATVMGAGWYLYVEKLLLYDVTFPLAAGVVVYGVTTYMNYIREEAAKRQAERQQRWIRNAFSSYVSPNLVRHLIENPGQLRLGGERRECTFLFTDLTDFTSLVEKSDPEVIVSLLNEYLDGMVHIAFQHDGTLDKIVGDAVTIIFSAPVVQPDHAARGVACALAMDSFAQAYAKAKRKEGIGLGKTRIGVNSGPVIIGNFGGDTVFDYTAHGDAINTAARMESVNKHLGTRVCISGFTVAGCPDFIGRPVGTLVLKGKTKGIEAFEPLTRAEAESPAVAAYLAAFELLKREDPGANSAFAALAENYPDDPLAALHLKRLRSGENGTTIVMTEK